MDGPDITPTRIASRVTSRRSWMEPVTREFGTPGAGRLRTSSAASYASIPPPGSLPHDAFEWQSVEVAVSASIPTPDLKIKTVETPDKELTIEAVLQKDARGHVVFNLFDTEQSYVQKLGVILHVFRDRLVSQKILTDPVPNLIFAGIDELYKFHLKFSAELEELVGVNSWSTTETRIGGLFLRSKDDLIRLYTKFIDSYAMSQKLMKKEEQENPDYQAFMRDFMILPVQRTARYHLLLKDLLKQTSAEHPDREDLNTAFEAMKELAAQVNEKKRKEEETRGLFEAFESTKNCPATLISSKRKLVMNVDVVEYRTNKPWHLFLSSDLLMITQPISKGGIFKEKVSEHAYKFVRWLDLFEMDVEHLGVINEAQKDVLRITIDPSKRLAESNTVPPDVPGNTITFKFDGPEATKNRTMFFLTLESEIKKNRETRGVKKEGGES
ncbi:Protein T2 [Rhizophlyctis rosea]|nr:Protein T2 [Rhizophlyctis rosea]